MLVVPRGRSSRPSPTGAQASLEKHILERASPRLGRPGMRSRDNGSLLEGANYSDTPQEPPGSSDPFLMLASHSPGDSRDSQGLANRAQPFG